MLTNIISLLEGLINFQLNLLRNVEMYEFGIMLPLQKCSVLLSNSQPLSHILDILA